MNENEVLGASGDGGQLDLGEFVRGASHDLANLFNAVSMNAELTKLLLDRAEPKRLREVLDNLIADCARCGRMIQGMQSFGADLYPHAPETVAVRDLVDAAIDIVAQDRPNALSCSCGEMDTQIVVDRAAFESAIAGLLYNALEAGASAVAIHFRRDEEFVVIEFRDNGAGIPVELRARAVEAFFTTHVGDAGHCGLGLTLAHVLARRHGGTLAIAANNGAGTCVELRLPQALAMG
ncbi:MAG TPA: HAMP domain-containing sensor histidine kinase [Rudaea sp.]|jgi:signal transduction histidine kinase